MADLYVGDDGKLHKVQGGADSVLPFNSELLTETKTLTESIGNNVDKNYEFIFSNNIEIVGILIESSSTNSTSCVTMYVPTLSLKQLIIGVASYLIPIGSITDANVNYRTVNILSIEGSTVTIHKGGNYANGTVTIKVTVLYK